MVSERPIARQRAHHYITTYEFRPDMGTIRIVDPLESGIYPLLAETLPHPFSLPLGVLAGNVIQPGERKHSVARERLRLQMWNKRNGCLNFPESYE